MIRLFDSHKIRIQKELEGLWDFSPISETDPNPTFQKYEYKLPVPGCFEMHPKFLTYRGKAVYRKIINIDDNSSLRFEFKGVSHTADIYFDGENVGHHYNAYTPFSVVIPDVKAGEHELKVYVDNSFSEKSALHIANDYYTYGGLIRPVSMEKVDHSFIERVEFTPIKSDTQWYADITLAINNMYGKKRIIEAEIQLENQEKINLRTIELEAGKLNFISQRIQFNEVIEWSNLNPQLYLLKTELFQLGETKPFDDFIERVGFRTIEIVGQAIYLNGSEIKLKGFNRHEDHALVGCSLPLQLMINDMEMIKETGANSIRTCHYPNDERFLDLCDENGIFVWEENHARGLSLENMQNPNFDLQCENCNREMVENHINHPSIIIWGLLNECSSNTPEGRKKYKKQINQLRLLDSSRPITFASCHNITDLCFDLVDIISLNIYSGWYLDDDTEGYYDQLFKWIQLNTFKDKPIIISEFGAAALYGFRDPARVKWSEERQSDILDTCLSVYMKRPEIAGTYIWQFADCKVTEDGFWFQSRAGSRNNKGILDMYRRPKLALKIVKKHYK